MEKYTGNNKLLHDKCVDILSYAYSKRSYLTSEERDIYNALWAGIETPYEQRSRISGTVELKTSIEELKEAIKNGVKLFLVIDETPLKTRAKKLDLLVK